MHKIVLGFVIKYQANLAAQKLTVRLYCETPNAVLDGTYDANNKSIVIAEQFQEFADQTVGDDGTLDVDFTLKKPEWYDKHPETLPYKMFVAEVLKKTKDANNNDVLQLVQSQYNTNEMLPFTIIRNDDNQIGIKILSNEAAADNESLKPYKQQYLYTNDALFVVRGEAKKQDVQPSPTIVHFEDIEVEEKATCYCNRDFTEDEVKELVKTVKGNSQLWGQSANMDDKSYKGLTFQLNAMFRKYGINKCIQKICFLAEVYAETGLFNLSEEGLSQYKSSQSTYKGRGILQLTGSDDGSGYYNAAGSYSDYATYSGHTGIVSTPALVATKLSYCIDSGGWEWSMSKKCPDWEAHKRNLEEEKLRIEKKKYFEKATDGNHSLNDIALLTEDDDKYFWLISKLLNGYPPKHKLSDNPNGWGHRKNAFGKLKSWFKYDKNVCKTGKRLRYTGNMPPWLAIALQEYNKYKGLREIDSPLKEKISEYFEVSSAAGLNYDHSDPWCGAFIAWCFEQTSDYKRINIKHSAAAFGWLADTWENGEACEAFVGSLIIFNFSHVAIIVGENTDGTKYVYLGGNQGNGDKRPGYQKIILGAVVKGHSSIKGITKPKKYVVKEQDKKLPKYNIEVENSGGSTR